MGSDDAELHSDDGLRGFDATTPAERADIAYKLSALEEREIAPRPDDAESGSSKPLLRHRNPQWTTATILSNSMRNTTQVRIHLRSSRRRLRHQLRRLTSATDRS